MTDTDIENIYKTALPESHYAGLRAVYDAGYFVGASIAITTSAQDASLTQAAPTSEVSIQTP